MILSFVATEKGLNASNASIADASIAVNHYRNGTADSCVDISLSNGLGKIWSDDMMT